MTRTRPRLPLRVGEQVAGTGSGAVRATPRGWLVLRTQSDGSTWTWEEWQLEGHDGSDVWLEYDHATREVALYRPVETRPPVPDLDRLRPRTEVRLRVHGRSYHLVVRERGTATVVGVGGSISEPVEVGQRVEYADLSTGLHLLSVERTGPDHAPRTTTHLGRPLDVDEQREVLGRRLSRPRVARTGGIAALVVLALLGLVAACRALPPTSGACTPRTLTTTAPDGTTEVLGTDDGTSCYRRPVYGGGGGGLGK